MTGEQRALLHLTLIHDLGPSGAHAIVHACAKQKININEIYRFGVTDFVRLGLTTASALILVQGLADLAILESELSLIQRAGARIVSMFDSEYPADLKTIGMPPLLLYVRGNFSCLNARTLAIVGSRRGNEYGHSFVNLIVPELAVHSWTIVSGGARGIDAMAHQAALTYKTPTAVVVGAGLLCPYPREHAGLFERIIENGGCIMSPFCMQSQPEPWHFPVRNRIIAGVSRGVVVVQAAFKSGAHSTAAFALEYGREVFAVPGPFNDELSAGCHRLLKQGATLVNNSQDILEELDPHYARSTRVSAAGTPKQLRITEQPLSMRDKIVLLCRDGACVDDLASALEVSMQEVYHELFSLQLSGAIAQDFTGMFRSSAF